MRAWREDAPARELVPEADPVSATKPRIGFVGAGHVGAALAVALTRAGWPVTAVASRSPERRREVERIVPGAATVATPSELLDLVDIVFVTVPDDAIAAVVADLRLYSGQAIVHTSGLLPSTVLEPALAAGCTAASFHPLVAFADRERAIAALPGAAIVLEGEERLVSLLAGLAEALGARPVRIDTAGKAAHHIAAVLAAGGLIGLLESVSAAARGAGLDDAGALAIYGPLARQALDNAAALGIEEALTGPFVRGDAGTVEQHLAALERLAPAALGTYRALGEAQLAVAERRGILAPEKLARLRRLLANGDSSSSM